MSQLNYDKCSQYSEFLLDYRSFQVRFQNSSKVRNSPVLFTFVSAQIEMVSQNYQKLESEEHIKLMEKLIEIMEDDDDVQNIWYKWEE